MEEKTFKDEVMDADELDEVVGGMSGEVYKDAVILYKIGYRGMGNDQCQLWEDFVANIPNIHKSFQQLGQKYHIDINIVLFNKTNIFFPQYL